MASQQPRTRTWDDAATDAAFRWNEQATKNVEKWGQQDILSLVLAKIEELGELAAAVEWHAEFEDTETALFAKQRLHEMRELGDRTQGFLEQTSETRDGQPLTDADRPDYGNLVGGLDEIRDELGDDAALAFQLEWALDQYNGGDA